MRRALLLMLAGCSGAAHPRTNDRPCPSPGADAAARRAAFAELRASWPRCEATVDALATAAGLAPAILRGALAHEEVDDAAIWSARAAVARRDLTTARRELDAAASSPVVLAERARVARAAGDDELADATLAQALALASLLDAGEATVSIPERIDGRVVSSPDGRRWASLAGERIIVHDAVTGLEVASVSTRRAGITEVFSFVLLDDGRVVISPYNDGETWIVDPADGVQVPLGERTSALALSPGGDTAALQDNLRLAIVDLRRGHEATILDRLDTTTDHTWTPGESWPLALEWRGDVIAAPMRTTGLMQNHLVDGKLVPGYTASPGLTAATLSPDGTELAVAYARVLGGFDVAGALAREVPLPAGVSIDGLSYADGVLYAIDQLPGDVYRVDASALTPLATGLPIVGRTAAMTDSWISLGATGRVVISDGGVVELGASPREIGARHVPGPGIQALAWNGGSLAVAADGDLFRIDATGVIGTARGDLGVARGSTFIVAPDGGRVWWSTPTGVRTWSAASVAVVQAAVPPDPAAAATLDDSVDRATLWFVELMAETSSAAEREAIENALLHRSVPGGPCFALSQDGATLVLQPADGEPVRVIDADTLEPRSLLRGPPAVQTLALVDDDQRLVAASADTTYVVNRKRGVVEREIPAPMITVSRDGRWLVTETDRQYRIHDLFRNHDLGALDVDDAVVAAFDPSGAFLAIGDRPGAIIVFDTATWEQVSRWSAHDEGIAAIVWRDAGVLASGGDGGVIRVWARDGAPLASIALGERSPATTGDADPDWIALYPDGTADGAASAWDQVALRVGAVPLGFGISPRRAAAPDAWSALFAAP